MTDDTLIFETAHAQYARLMGSIVLELGLLHEGPHLVPDAGAVITVDGRPAQGHQHDGGVGVQVQASGLHHLLQGGQGGAEHEHAHLPLPDTVLQQVGDHAADIVQTVVEQGGLLPRRHDEGRPRRGGNITFPETVGTYH